MKLTDLRRYCVRQRVSIWFTMEDGMQCVVTEQGLCQVPALAGTPQFNLNEELSKARSFRIEKAVRGAKGPVETLTYPELEALTAGGETPVHGDHDE